MDGIDPFWPALGLIAFASFIVWAWGRLDEAAWRRQRERAERAGQHAE